MINCPNCGHAAQANDKFCANCGIQLDVDNNSITKSLINPEYISWENRGDASYFQAFWATWKESVFHPVRFFINIPNDKNIGSPLFYALIISLISVIFIQPITMLSLYFIGLIFGFNQFSGISETLAISFISLIYMIPNAMIYTVIFIFIQSALAHYIGRWRGWTHNNYYATFRTTAYGMGPILWGFVPFVGVIAGFAGWIIISIIGYREAHKSTDRQAIIAVLIPLLAYMIVAILASLLLLALLGYMFSGNFSL